MNSAMPYLRLHFPAAELHYWLIGTVLYCLGTGAQGYEQLARSHYAATPKQKVKPATSWLQVLCPTHCATLWSTTASHNLRKTAHEVMHYILPTTNLELQNSFHGGLHFYKIWCWLLPVFQSKTSAVKTFWFVYLISIVLVHMTFFLVYSCFMGTVFSSVMIVPHFSDISLLFYIIVQMQTW